MALKRRFRMASAVAAALLVAGAGLSVLHAAVGGVLPTPGAFHEVDDASLYMECRGAGAPTIVLEAGATGFAETWGWVQADLALDHRVCAYDRAGLGRSTGGDRRFDPIASVDRLDALLTDAGERAPFVMVGHSLGGALALMYAARHPDRTAAVAMIDPPHPDLLSRIPRAEADDYRDFAAKLRLASRLAPLGVMHAVRPFSGPAATLPAAGREVAALLEVSPAHLRRSYDELNEWPAIQTAFEAALRDNRRPLLVLSAGDPTAGRSRAFLAAMQGLQRELATGGRFAVVPHADHYSIILDRANAARVAADIRALAATPPA